MISSHGCRKEGREKEEEGVSGEGEVMREGRGRVVG